MDKQQLEQETRRLAAILKQGQRTLVEQDLKKLHLNDLRGILLEADNKHFHDLVNVVNNTIQQKSPPPSGTQKK